MKKISIFILIVLASLIFVTCQQDEFRSFKDYDYTTTYFPYQYPVRTLILGDYDLADNTRDNELKFLISARIGGVYRNNSDVVVKYQIDESLVNRLQTNPNQWDGKTTTTPDTLAPLPSRYYSFNGPENTIIIPKGSYHGGVEVQLTQDFLDDPKSWTTHYVIPLRITSSTTDSILSGKTTNPNPDSRLLKDWDILPKDFTVFGIKFVNAYHGNYFHKGKSIITVEGSNVAQTIYYSAISSITGNPVMEKNELWSLQTTGRRRVTVTGRLQDPLGTPGEFKINIDFNENGNCTISETDDSLFPVTGTGKFVEKADTWGGKPRDAIYLNYKVTDGDYTSTITDTLVIRDKGVNFQQFSPELIE